MNIYLIERTDNWSYDDYDAAVVIAENEEAAKRQHPANNRADDDHPNTRFRSYKWSETEQCWYQGNIEKAFFNGWVTSLDKIEVTLLGPSSEIEERTVLGSFNAG